MLQQPEADDYVVGTGDTHSVQEFVEVAFGHVGLDWREFVRVDPRFVRPAEVNQLTADAAKARRVLGWVPQTRFDALVRLMVDADLDLEAAGTSLAGYRGPAAVAAQSS